MAAPFTAVLADRHAYAEVAGSRRAGARSRVPGEPVDASPDVSLLQDAAAFVNAVSAQENLVDVAVSLLRSEDEKVKQRMLERSLEMKFGKTGTVSDEPPQVINDMPKPGQD